MNINKIVNGSTSGEECIQQKVWTSNEKLTDENAELQLTKQMKGLFNFKTKLIPRNIAYLGIANLLTLYFLFTFDFLKNWKTVLWMIALWFVSGFGVTAGAHRYWTHRCFKTKKAFGALLYFCYSTAGQNKLYDWVRDHRVHHKYTETDADPHNSNRGFFFSHVGWLLMKKHPEVIKKGRLIDMSDITSDPVVQFGDKYFTIIWITNVFILPCLIPMYFWNETFSRSFISQFIRYVLTLHCTWSVNSFAHLWGPKPYDKDIKPSENIGVSLLAGGEGFHNYHHAFPWDYRASELPWFYANMTSLYIDIFSYMGFIYDLKRPSPELVKEVVIKRGDGSHHVWGEVPRPKSKIN